MPTEPSYSRHRFPPQIISYTVWLYHRFALSFRDIEDFLAERGITVSHESIRCWCGKFGSAYARRLRKMEGQLGDVWHLDELFVNNPLHPHVAHPKLNTVHLISTA